MKNSIKKYLGSFITFLVGAAICLIILFSKNIFQETDPMKIYRTLTDAFFVPGIIIAGFGLLVLASNGGAFDMLSYGMMRFISLFKHDLNDIRFKTYSEYVSAKHETKHPYMYIVWVGLFYIALSLLFLYFYYQNL